MFRTGTEHILCPRTALGCTYKKPDDIYANIKLSCFIHEISFMLDERIRVDNIAIPKDTKNLHRN